MYLKQLYVGNMGPIAEASINASFDQEGRPRPIVLVGKNGSGKSILLSNIVDAFYELGQQSFNDVTVPTDNHDGHKYFKIAMSSHIKIGEESLLGYASFSTAENDKSLEYVYHRGKLDKSELLRRLSSIGITTRGLIDKVNENDKIVTSDKTLVEKEFSESVLCYFPAYRFAVPDWEGEDYSKRRTENPYKRMFRGELSRQIEVDNARYLTPRWLEDVVVDSRCDLLFKNGAIVPESDLNNVRALKTAKENVETILSAILEHEIVLKLGYRSEHESRLAICDKSSGSPIAPTFDSLSTGQTILADIFLTILRYADAIDINKSIILSDIKGIVVIDEIDAHLHADLQYNTLPRVMRLFPNIQFVVTAHAPLFVMGMEALYGPDGFDLYEMPECARIESEEYREFLTAHEKMLQSRVARKAMEEEVKRAITKVNNSVAPNDQILVLTEGPTDWMHLKHAWKSLKSYYPDIKDKLRFFEFYPIGKAPTGGEELQMSDAELVKMCESYAKMRQPSRMIFLADADNQNVTKALKSDGRLYRSWGNGVYSFILPNPGIRDGFADVCIEHYYTDDELRTPKTIGGIPRRLFLTGEFNHVTGQTSDHAYFYENHRSVKKRGKYGIIEGDNGNRVIALMGDSETTPNIALPKFEFASAVLNEEQGFASFDVEPFRKIFDVINAIANETATN